MRGDKGLGWTLESTPNIRTSQHLQKDHYLILVVRSHCQVPQWMAFQNGRLRLNVSMQTTIGSESQASPHSSACHHDNALYNQPSKGPLRLSPGSHLHTCITILYHCQHLQTFSFKFYFQVKVMYIDQISNNNSYEAWQILTKNDLFIWGHRCKVAASNQLEVLAYWYCRVDMNYTMS